MHGNTQTAPRGLPPHPHTDRALCRLTSEVDRNPVYSTWYGHRRQFRSDVYRLFWAGLVDFLQSASLKNQETHGRFAGPPRKSGTHKSRSVITCLRASQAERAAGQCRPIEQPGWETYFTNVDHGWTSLEDAWASIWPWLTTLDNRRAVFRPICKLPDHL